MEERGGRKGGQGDGFSARGRGCQGGSNQPMTGVIRDPHI